MGKTHTEITSDINNMKQYLKDIYLLEKEIYCSERAKQKITDKINSLGIEEKIKYPERPQGGQWAFASGIGEYILCLLLYGVCGLFVGGVIGFFLCAIIDNILAFIIPIVICSIIGACYFAWVNKVCADHYEYEINAYKQKKEKDKKRVEKELKRIPAYRANENLYSQNISACENTLKQLYDLDIIFPKYRNFIAISQIYEYYMSGRCTELEGHEGAYNIYESEVRQNVIIIQLNAVLANLNEIKQTQYMIYDAICEANSRLAHIESNTEAIAYNTAVIAENSAICARYYN